MGCQESGSATEYEFVSDIVRRDRSPHTCCGPSVRLGFAAVRLACIEESFLSPQAHDLLWEGFEPDPIDAMYFTLCALHWMELACLVSMRGHMYDNAVWRSEGSILLTDICAQHGWDAKEIANAFTWQRVRLT